MGITIRAPILLTILITATLMGGLLGLLLAWSRDSGLLVEWQQLPKPPDEVTELYSDYVGNLFIKTRDGKTYHYRDGYENPWVETGWPQTAGRNANCSGFSKFRLSFMRSSDGIAICISAVTLYPEGSGEAAYALDKDGDLWAWSHEGNVLGGFLNLIQFGLLGSIAGFTLGALLLGAIVLRNPSAI